jgi:hypothetical protein
VVPLDQLIHDPDCKDSPVPPRLAYEGSCGRVSPLWDISSAAKKGEANARVQTLAQPRPLHPHHRKGHTEVQRPVPLEALTAKLTGEQGSVSWGVWGVGGSINVRYL